MPTNNATLDMIAHGRAAMQKAKEIRAQQIADNTKLAEAAPAVVDALIANNFLQPEVRDTTIRRMQKTGFAINLFRAIAEQAVPKRAIKQGYLGTSEKSAASRSTSVGSVAHDDPNNSAANAIWESMLY